MKLHILNDLHIEFEDFEPPVTDADVVVLAGDICVGTEGLQWTEARFRDGPVVNGGQPARHPESDSS